MRACTSIPARCIPRREGDFAFRQGMTYSIEVVGNPGIGPGLRHVGRRRNAVYRWHVLFTKPRHEWRVAEALQARDLDVYVPVMWYHGKRGTLLARAFFPRYMFARLDWDATGMVGVQWTPGLKRVVSFDGQPAWLPDAKVAYLREKLEVLDGDEFLKLKPGEPVRVTRGPFAEVSRIPANLEDRVRAVPGVAAARRFVSHTIQREFRGRPLRIVVQGLSWLALSQSGT